jgi:hypothetical protein
MPIYRKKPVEIEARQFTTNNGPIEHMDDLVAWMNESGQPDRYPRLTDDVPVARHDNTSIFINTLEGEHRADVGDYIIKGVKGEFYPCKPDIFEATYDQTT